MVVRTSRDMYGSKALISTGCWLVKLDLLMFLAFVVRVMLVILTDILKQMNSTAMTLLLIHLEIFSLIFNAFFLLLIYYLLFFSCYFTLHKASFIDFGHSSFDLRLFLVYLNCFNSSNFKCPVRHALLSFSLLWECYFLPNMTSKNVEIDFSLLGFQILDNQNQVSKH